MTKGIAAPKLVMNHRVGLERWKKFLIRKLQMVMDIQRVKVSTTCIKSKKHERMECIEIESSNKLRCTVSWRKTYLDASSILFILFLLIDPSQKATTIRINSVYVVEEVEYVPEDDVFSDSGKYATNENLVVHVYGILFFSFEWML